MKKRIKANVIRNRILELLKAPKNVTQLKKELKEISSFGTLAYHLRLMKEEGLIASRKQKDKQGQPTQYFKKEFEKKITTFKDIKDFEDYLKEGENKTRTFILNLLKEKPLKTSEIERIVYKKFGEAYGEIILDRVTDILFNEDNKGYLITKHFITKKGREFLKNS